MMVHQHVNGPPKPLGRGKVAAIKYLMKKKDCSEERARLIYNSLHKTRKSDLCQKAMSR